MKASFLTQLFPEKNIVAPLPKVNTDIDLGAIRVLVIVDKFLNEKEERPQIEKILSACQLQQNEFIITEQKIAWSQIAQHKNIKEVILFNTDPKLLFVQYRLFKYRFHNLDDKKILLTDSIAIIMQHQQLKADFWNKCLKPYFIGN